MPPHRRHPYTRGSTYRKAAGREVGRAPRRPQQHWMLSPEAYVGSLRHHRTFRGHRCVHAGAWAGGDRVTP